VRNTVGRAKSTKASSKRRQERLAFASAVIGVVSGVLGLVAPIVGLPDNVANAMGRGDANTKTQLEIQDKRAKLAHAAPKLDVSYLILTTDVALELVPQPTSKDAVTLLSFPPIKNELLEHETLIINDTIDDAGAAGCRLGKNPERSLTFLVIQNRGNRDATGIEVRTEQLQLTGPVRVDEAAVHGDDYVARLRAAAHSTAPVPVMVPRPLARGEGVRIPLWVSFTREGLSNPWCVVSRTMLLPSSVRFTDPDLNAALPAMPVRRLQSPMVLGSGIVARG
jgi:hypothetical protein